MSITILQTIKHCFSQMKTDEKISLLLRHSDREDIPKGSFGNEILLNEKANKTL